MILNEQETGRGVFAKWTVPFPPLTRETFEASRGGDRAAHEAPARGNYLQDRMDRLDLLPVCRDGEERRACLEVEDGLYLRLPPPPKLLEQEITTDDKLFETIHMGPVTVDTACWRLSVDGLGQRPFSLNLAMLRALPKVTVTAFHECYGSPLKPPTIALWRIGNVKWGGVRLRTLLEHATPTSKARYVWSDGLDHGEFYGIKADRYQKDLPISKAMSDEVLVVYEMNGHPLEKLRGGPVRLVVPGWFGTNSTKWLCRLSVQAERSPSPYTTSLYNEQIPEAPEGKTRPVWQVEPKSMIVKPEPGASLACADVEVLGWAWCDDEIATVDVSFDGGETWRAATVAKREEYEWQKFQACLGLVVGIYTVMARATFVAGLKQPMCDRRNHVHSISFTAH